MQVLDQLPEEQLSRQMVEGVEPISGLLSHPGSVLTTIFPSFHSACLTASGLPKALR